MKKILLSLLLFAGCSVQTGEAENALEFPCSPRETDSKSDLPLGLVIDASFIASGEKQCDYKTGYKSALTTHMRIHTGERPFACDHCDFKASKKSAVTRHIKMHTGDKPYACADCGYRTTRKDALTRHMKTHKLLYMCSRCDYKSATKSATREHLESHIGENN